MVEAAGQLIHIFRYGLDYSFTSLDVPMRGERVVVLPTLVPRSVILLLHLLQLHTLEAYESLAGLPVSRSPDGVGIGQAP